MAVFKATQNKSTTAGKFKATKNRSYDSAIVYDWESRNKEAYDALEKYRMRINSGGYLSEEDLSSYRKALDSYVDTSTRLRGLSKHLGQAKDDEDEWSATIADMESGYKGISEYFSQWKDEDSFKKAIAASKEHQEKLELDTDAYSSEIEALEARRDVLSQAFDSEGSSAVTGLEGKSFSEISKEYDELEKQIQEKKLYLNDVTRLQDGARLAEVADKDSEN